LAYAQEAVRRHLLRWEKKEQAWWEQMGWEAAADDPLDGEEGESDPLSCLPSPEGDPCIWVLIEAWLASLGEREREVVERHVWDEETLAEIGREMGLSKAYARVLWQRSCKKLRRWYEEEGEH
jgi:DNA-directed RNA polymerase specialized sigma24 family protein